MSCFRSALGNRCAMPGSAFGLWSGGGFCWGTNRRGLGELRWINLHVVDNFLKFGVQVPFRVVLTQPKSSSTIQFEEIIHNVQIDPAKFAKPPSARAPAKSTTTTHAEGASGHRATISER